MRKTKAEINIIREQVLDLWAAGATSPEIQDRLPGVTEKSISNLLARARKKGGPRAVLRGNAPGTNFAGRRWTDNEVRAALEIRKKFPKLSDDEIGAKLGRTGRSVQSKLILCDPDGKREYSHEPKVVVPEFVEELRDRRYSVAPRDLTAAYFGDPLPGFSALDRRVAA